MKIFYSTQHKNHDPSRILVDGHAFVSEDLPERVDLIIDALQSAGFGPSLDPFDYGLDPIRRVHDPSYLDFLQKIYQENTAYYGEERPVVPETFSSRMPRRRPKSILAQKGYYAFGVGSPILKGTWDAAYWSAQCAISAADCVRGGEKLGYALCRPPGHHAAAGLYGGFCFLNNAAIVARYLGDHVAILDIDYHHGNGTQEIFYSDPTVLFCSLHADPDQDYPYFWGAADETGADAGEGYNHNFPLPLGTGDDAYLTSLDSALAIVRSYRPNVLVVSVGLDIAQGDPAGGFNITPIGLCAIATRIQSLQLPMVLVQEGGYRLDTLPQNALAFFSPFK